MVPENPKKGGIISYTKDKISYTKELEDKYGVTIFFAAVKEVNGKLISNGGRVLSICKTGDDPSKDIYKAVNELKFNDKFYRKDIGDKLCKSL